MISLSLFGISWNQIGVIFSFDLIFVLFGVSLHLLFSQSISFLRFISSGCLFVWLSSFPIWSRTGHFYFCTIFSDLLTEFGQEILNINQFLFLHVKQHRLIIHSIFFLWIFLRGLMQKMNQGNYCLMIACFRDK